MKKYLVYKKSDGLVINTIVYDGVSPLQIENELDLEICPAGSFAGIGWIRIAPGEFMEFVENAGE